MIQRRLNQSERSPSRLVCSVPMFVDEVLGESNRAVEPAPMDLKLQILTDSQPSETAHTVRFSYWTLVLGRETLVSQLPLREEFSQPSEVHAVPPLLILDGRPTLGNPDLDFCRFAPHPRIDYEFYEELRRVSVLAPQGLDDALVRGDSKLIIHHRMDRSSRMSASPSSQRWNLLSHGISAG